jgi:phage shock protein C
MDKKLRRSKNQIVGGVCAGLGDFIGWDYTLVRAIYAVLTIFSGAFPGFLIYIVLWLIMPLEQD